MKAKLVSNPGAHVKLSTLPALYALVNHIKQDLITIKNDLVIGTNSRCGLLRQHLSQYVDAYNKAGFAGPLTVLNWTTAQLEPRDLWIRLSDMFDFPDSAVIDVSTYGANDGTCDVGGKDAQPGPSFERRVPVAINVDAGELLDNSGASLRIKQGTLHLIDFVNKTTCAHLGAAEYKIGQTMYKTRIEETEYTAAPMLYIHVDRLSVPALDKLITRVMPPSKIRLRDNSAPLELSGITIHRGSRKGGHYTAYLNCAGTWYFYNDVGSTRLVRIGTWEEFIASEGNPATSQTMGSIFSDATDYFYL